METVIKTNPINENQIKEENLINFILTLIKRHNRLNDQSSSRNLSFYKLFSFGTSNLTGKRKEDREKRQRNYSFSSLFIFTFSLSWI